MIPFVIQIWMFLTPVLYPVKIVPARWQWLLLLNPLTGIVDAYRSAILGKPFQWASLALSSAIIVVAILIGTLYFRKTERRFADII